MKETQVCVIRKISTRSLTANLPLVITASIDPLEITTVMIKMLMIDPVIQKTYQNLILATPDFPYFLDRETISSFDVDQLVIICGLDLSFDDGRRIRARRFISSRKGGLLP